MARIWPKQLLTTSQWGWRDKHNSGHSLETVFLPSWRMIRKLNDAFSPSSHWPKGSWVEREKKNRAAWLLLFYGTRYWVVPFSLRKLKLPENNRLEIWPQGMWYTVSQKCSSPKWAGKGEGSTETVRLNMQHACKEPPNKHAGASAQSLRDPPGMG